MGRYEFICIAPEVSGPGSTDDLDEALLFTSDYYGSHWEIWDTKKKKYIDSIHCQEELDELKKRIEEKREFKSV